MFTAKEAVTEYFHGTISYWKLLQDFKAGKIPGSKVGARRILFRKEVLDKWMKDMEEQATNKRDSDTLFENKIKDSQRDPKTMFKKINRF